MTHTSTVKIYLQPGAKKSEICGKHGEYIKIKIQAPPIDGKANEALIHSGYRAFARYDVIFLLCYQDSMA
ncbi:MAG: hypothetical protein A3I77_00465 [Gammaproteobacteria bacterium RIFCSPLOWO2_02_FULL_42_14]|nr:MAG: hypothetical protein A3B71_08550 [Gammaproteobacteria bacterium RIFCSPHIGHO2_02_FULL_42_43]OGT29300.1 MAG: hypothetical protein A2624_04685 [Gammaproteobacteria bacterium RIFCSPHIGHO2_01_FULL_42_8]OGT50759.1 MAG: hypothetical protein A3E54_00745 [Gammaproteobacteria bacterium RIFCSPHIGHO2_12_FULL_41_25]OGT61744.1 MAG: hypothetical protein A3I77_00465 [Gammaproteobacteria bacterium RIFCSPLOWO2_02_FULL_42_14]OGT85488.1 MAG: hypothetical protein A3G86_06655 [Gammaproteobacteria bacterium R